MNESKKRLLHDSLYDVIKSQKPHNNGYVVCSSSTLDKMLNEIQTMLPDHFHAIIRGAVDQNNKVVKAVFLGGRYYLMYEAEAMSDDSFLFVPENYPLKFIYKNF